MERERQIDRRKVERETERKREIGRERERERERDKQTDICAEGAGIRKRGVLQSKKVVFRYNRV